MVTKGQILSVDYTGNTCEVRMPYFESAGIKDRISATATFGNQPGMYNGYKAGDVVWIAFEDGEANKPVVIGKLFLGVSEEKDDPRGVINCESGVLSNDVTLPLSTKLAYEKDSSLAQNGETKYDRISDLANKLGSITAQQDKTSYDVTGVISTANSLKSEISAVKASSGSRNTYAQEKRPEKETPNKLSEEEQAKLTETFKYVGYYILTGGKYKEVTEDNKDTIGIYPPYTEAYKMQRLSDGDIWQYTGADLFEVDETKAETADKYIGYYVYEKDGKPAEKETPEKTDCPECDKKDCWKAVDGDGCEFTLIDSLNYKKIDVDKNIKKYTKHLSNNATFYYKDGSWQKGAISDIATYGSAIEQTASSVSAKVNKTHTNGEETEFGWQLLENVNEKEAEIGEQRPGDDDGQFTVYSTITYNDSTSETKDVLHINKNGMWVKGNLEVEDNEGQRIFAVLPDGEYSEYTDETTGEKSCKYKGTPKVIIGGFTVDKTTLENESIGFRVGSEGLSVSNSTTESGEKKEENEFSVLSDGTIWGKKLYIEQDKKHDAVSASYFDGNVCGHQMKVDTVELATTNTDQGTDQTSGFRVEEYIVTTDEEAGKAKGEYVISFGIEKAVDTRKKNTAGEWEYTPSDTCVQCVLQNKTIGAMINLTYITKADEEKGVKSETKFVSFSVAGTLLGYPYNSDGSTTGNQEKYLPTDTGIKQSDDLVKIKIIECADGENRIASCIRAIKQNDTGNYEYYKWSECEYKAIDALSNITDCEKIESLTVTSWTPQREEYFTGDFLASTGYFKDKYGNFTLGMVTDVFSLPWKSNESLLIETDRVDMYGNVKTRKRIVEGDDNVYAYKELKAGDYCTVYTGLTTAFNSWVYDSMLEKIVKTDPEKILPGFDDFTYIEALSLTQIQKHYKLDEDEIFPFESDRNYSYKIEVSSYGAFFKMYGSIKKPTYKYEGQMIQLEIAEVKPRLSDDKYTDDVSVYVPCPRRAWIGTADAGTAIEPYSGDLISLMIYGGNAAVKSVSSTTGVVTYELGIQNSSSLLRATNAATISALSNPITSTYSLSRISPAITIDSKTDIGPNIPYIKPNTNIYLKGE